MASNGRDRSQSPQAAERRSSRSRSRSPGAGDAAQYREFFAYVNEREQCRANKDWDSADRIREQLKAKGVQIYDKTKKWVTPDGRTWTIGEQFSPAPTTVPSIPSSIPLDIKQLVDAREKARQDKDWAKADELRNECKARGIHIFDKEKLYKAPDGSVGFINSWSGAELPLNELAIAMLLKDREVCRANKDWTGADNIRDLMKAKGVQIFDKKRMWKSNDGRQGSLDDTINPNLGSALTLPSQLNQMGMGMGMNPMMNYGLGMMQGGMGMGGMSMGTGGMGVGATVLGRGQQKEQQQWGGLGMGAGLGMNGGGLGMTGGGLGMSGGGLGMSGGGLGMGGLGLGGVDQIQALINQRESARQLKDFKTADALRDMLKSLGVLVYDKEKIWKTNDGRQGEVPSYDALMLLK